MPLPMLRKLIFVSVALHAVVALAEVYSWKDADGKTHFSDTPPVGKEPSLKTVTLPPTGTATPAPAQAKPASAARSKVIPENKAAAAERQAACEKARADLQALDDKPRRVALGKGGKSHALDGEERAAEEADLQKLIKENCS